MFLEINQIYKSFGQGDSRVEVLKGIDLSLEKGGFCVLLGPSGSGKSTLLNIIGGIDSADAGEIVIGGESMSRMNERQLTMYRRKHLGYIFQMYNLIPNLTVRENIEVGAYLSDKSLNVDELLKLLGLWEHRGKVPSQLSGGQQQRTAIGRAVVKNPDILLCDEPTGALDYKTSKEILKLIEQVNREYGNTVIMVTHNDAIKYMADTVVRLRDEQIDAVKSQLIDEICGEISPDTGELPQVTVDTDGISISLDSLLADLLEGVQAELDMRYGNIKEARDAVPDLEVPDLSALNPDRLQELTQTLEEMQTALGVIGEYAQGLSSTQDSLSQLAEGMEELRGGVKALSQGSQGLTEGLQQFETAVGTAAEGSSKLNTALSQVSSAGGKLGSAFWELVDGMNAFADGVSEFDKEGIQSLAELTGPEYKEVIRRVKAARDAEHSYNNFSGILDGQKGSVRFVIETEEIEADD